ncbi:MAG: hypothetical protein AB7G75_18775 [Candidatus Binatia bacterium]
MTRVAHGVAEKKQIKTSPQAVQPIPIMTGPLSEGQAHLEPDILLACQVRPRNNFLHRSEWLLMLAVLTDALHVLNTYHPQKRRRTSKERRQWEADCAWVREKSEAPFSFAYVCDQLGLDRQALRSHAERLIAGEDLSNVSV